MNLKDVLVSIGKRVKQAETSVPDDPVKSEVHRIVEEIGLGTRRELPNISRKDIPKILEGLISADILTNSNGPCVIQRQPNNVSTFIGDGIPISISGIDENSDKLRVSFGERQYLVHDPYSVGDILIREMTQIGKKQKL